MLERANESDDDDDDVDVVQDDVDAVEEEEEDATKGFLSKALLEASGSATSILEASKAQVASSTAQVGVMETCYQQMQKALSSYEESQNQAKDQQLTVNTICEKWQSPDSLKAPTFRDAFAQPRDSFMANMKGKRRARS